MLQICKIYVHIINNIALHHFCSHFLQIFYCKMKIMQWESTGIFNLGKKKKRNFVQSQGKSSPLVISFRTSWSVNFVRGPNAESWSQSNLQMDKTFSLPQQGLSQLPGNTSEQEGWTPDSASLLQGNRASTSWIRALKILVGQKEPIQFLELF